MRWTVGVDLRPGSEGAVQFARWITGAGRPPESEVAEFVHVLEEEHLRFALRFHHLDEVSSAARAAAKRVVSGAGEVRVVQGLTAEDALEAERATSGADAIVVGRAAGREGHHVVRLGRVARRLLRRLASPVVVVPPDLRAEELGDGPIVALASLGADSLEACRLAGRLASSVGRPLAVCHVARAAELPYLPPGSTRDALEAHRVEAEQALARWLAEGGVQADVVRALVGSPVEAALTWAEMERAPLVVTGSRHLSAAERVFEPSLGSALAATARLPVALVPPPPA